ncbi:LOW QUALITY PROTEIN: hypothetical protein KUTeg_012438, partial [Tegillarca granosa]
MNLEILGKTRRRRYGSRKFASYMAATTFVATCLELLTFYGLQMMDIKLDPLPSGPLCILYAFLIPYYFDLPRVAMGHILGVPVTGKSLVYILALQAGSGSKESVIVAACGILSGLLWRINFLKLQTIFRIPTKIFQTVFGNVLDSPPPSEENLPMGATLELQRQERYDQLEQQMIWQSMQQQHARGGGEYLTGGQVTYRVVQVAQDGTEGAQVVTTNAFPVGTQLAQ